MSAHRAAKAATTATRRLRWAPLSIAAGVVATGALALSMNGTLSAFTATLTNANSAAAGTLVMQEQSTVGGVTTTCNSTDGNSVATNTASCTGINAYGAATNLVPGGSSVTTVKVTNTGTATASSFTLAAGQCSQSGNVTGSATDLCSKMTVNITEAVAGNVVATKTLAAFNTAGSVSLGSMAPNASATYTITATLPAGLGNTYQGLTATQGLTWTFNAGS